MPLKKGQKLGQRLSSKDLRALEILAGSRKAVSDEALAEKIGSTVANAGYRARRLASLGCAERTVAPLRRGQREPRALTTITTKGKTDLKSGKLST